MPKKIHRKKNFAKKNYAKKMFASKILFSPKELSWVEIQLIFNLGSWNLAFRLNLQKYDKTGSFIWFSLVCFVWFSLLLQLSWEETQLTLNLGSWNFGCQFKWKNGDQIFWDQIMFSSSALIRPSSRLTVSAWVSPSSTPACWSLCLIDQVYSLKSRFILQQQQITGKL